MLRRLTQGSKSALEAWPGVMVNGRKEMCVYRNLSDFLQEYYDLLKHVKELEDNVGCPREHNSRIKQVKQGATRKRTKHRKEQRNP